MNERFKKIFEDCQKERERQFDLPGSEWDHKNSPNDWVAKAAKYLVRNVGTGISKPSVEDFAEDLIKSMAVIIATLEHIPHMKDRNELQ